MNGQGMGQGLAGQGQQGMQMQVQEIARLLEQGITPDELLQQGVPKDLIDMAIRMLQQPTQQPVAAPAGGGLAAQQGLIQ